MRSLGDLYLKTCNKSCKNKTIIKTIIIKNTDIKNIYYYIQGLNIIVAYLSSLCVDSYYTFSSNKITITLLHMEYNLELISNMDSFTSAMKFYCFKEICEIVRIFQSFDLIHGNIKPTNVFITKERKLCTSDYFLNELRELRNHSTLFYCYLSPEQILGLEVSKQSDIWSLGCLLYFLLTKQHLFSSTSFYHLIKLQHEKNRINLTYPSIYNEVINSSLKYKPSNRIRITEILQLICKSILLYNILYIVLDNAQFDDFYNINDKEIFILRLTNNVMISPNDERMLILQTSI